MAMAVGTPASAMISLANALEASSWAAALLGPNTGMPAVADGVGHAGGEGRLGAHHHQVDAQLGGQGRHGVGIVAVDGVGGDQLADAGVAGSCVDLGHVGVGEQGADNGVFAAAGANDEYLHSLQGYFVDRAGS